MRKNPGSVPASPRRTERAEGDRTKIGPIFHLFASHASSFVGVGGEHKSSPGASCCKQGENGGKKSGPEPSLELKDLPATLEHRFPSGFDVVAA